MYGEHSIGQPLKVISVAFKLPSWRVVAERLRARDSSSGVSDQQSVGSSPGRGTCVLEQDTLP